MSDQFKLGDHVLYQGKTYRFPGEVCAITDDGQIVVRAFGSPNGDYAGMKHIFGPSQLVHAARPVSAGEAEGAPAAILTADDERLLERALMASTEKIYDIEPAPAAMPSEDETARVLCEARHQMPVSPDQWSAEMAHIKEMEAKHPAYIAGFSTGTEAVRQARAILSLFQERFASILAEKERIAEAYDACVSVARKRLDNIAPELEEALPRLCNIDRATWLLHKEQAPIMAVDMLEHAKLKAAEARALAAESALAAERERCAKVVEFYRAEVWGASAPRTALAEAIRAKGE